MGGSSVEHPSNRSARRSGVDRVNRADAIVANIHRRIPDEEWYAPGQMPMVPPCPRWVQNGRWSFVSPVGGYVTLRETISMSPSAHEGLQQSAALRAAIERQVAGGGC